MDDCYLKEELYERFQKDPKIIDFLQDAALDGLWYWDLIHPENEWMNSKFWETLGYDPSKKKHSPSEWQSLIFKSDLGIAKKKIKVHLENPDHPYDQIVRYIHKDGSTVWIRCRGLAIRDENGEPLRMLGAHTDVTDLMTSYEQINELKNDYEKVFNGTQDALFLIEVKGRKHFEYIRNNTSHRVKTGLTQTMIEGKTPQEVLGQAMGDKVTENYQECVDNKAVVSYEETLDLPLGKRVWHTTLTPIIKQGEVEHIVGSAVDITEKKKIEEELVRRANYDALTGLANRDNLTRTVDQAVDDKTKRFVFIFIDLDRFKKVNDEHGHLAGDHMLETIAERLLDRTNKQDLVSRLGGDEFVILKYDLYEEEAIDAFMQGIIETIREPVEYNGSELEIDLSVGYSRFPRDGKDYDKLSFQADKAMYKMKRR